MISVNNLTMTYPNGKGIFDVDFSVPKGQITGFIGPNGSGKTTTIRALLGFMKAQSGECSIDGRDCFACSSKNCEDIGFIAGEPAFPDGMTGTAYLDFLIDLRSKTGKSREEMQKRRDQLVRYFEFDTRYKIKRMSKGMKQKVAIVSAFMHAPSIYILDEPTSGLDPLMQNKFVELLLAVRKRGATALVSSHIFEEVEKTCDQVIIIKDGRIAEKGSVQDLKTGRTKSFIVTTPDVDKIKLPFALEKLGEDKVKITIPFGEVDKFIKFLSKYNIQNIAVQETSLESIFLNLYGSNSEEASNIANDNKSKKAVTTEGKK